MEEGRRGDRELGGLWKERRRGRQAIEGDSDVERSGKALESMHDLCMEFQLLSEILENLKCLPRGAITSIPDTCETLSIISCKGLNHLPTMSFKNNHSR